MPKADQCLSLCALASGSKGNAYWIEGGGTTILVDAGISLRQLTRRVEEIERSVEQIDHLFVTHEHADHIKGLERLLSRHRPVVWASRGTLRALRGTIPDGAKVRMLNGKIETAGAFQVRAVAVSHDAIDPVAYRFDLNGHSAAVLTDTGDWSREMVTELGGADLLVCEANHDPHMLEKGPYPWYLKQRVASRTGHLSNQQGADFTVEAVKKGTKALLLGHLSETNNSPTLALDVFHAAVEAAKGEAKIDVASQDRPSFWLKV